MNVEDAIYDAVHDYPGGAASLAPRMGLAPSTLQSMASPKIDSHGWSLKRFRALLAFAGLKPLEALCEEHGGLFVPLGRFGDLPQARLLKQLHAFAKEFGDVPRAIEDALKTDGRVTANELQEIQRQLADVCAAGAALLAVVRQIHEQRVAVGEVDRP